MTESNVKTREQMNATYQWDLTPLFASDEEFESGYAKAENNLDKITAYKGRLGKAQKCLVKLSIRY